VAPTLEGYYSSTLVTYLNQISELSGALESMYKRSYWFVYYFYCNFYTYVGVNDDIDLSITYPEDGTGYNTFVYNQFFRYQNGVDRDGEKTIKSITLDAITIAQNATVDLSKLTGTIVYKDGSKANTLPSDLLANAVITGLDSSLEGVQNVIVTFNVDGVKYNVNLSVDVNNKAAKTKKGCKGSLGATSLLIFSFASLSGMIIMKKKKENA
jgi:hypothetical protein